MVIAPTESELSEVIRDFKSFTAKQLLKAILENPKESRKEWLEMVFKFHGNATKQNEKYAFWQKTSHPIALWTLAVIRQKVEYIYQNPVRAGFVYEPHDWILSSASIHSPIKVLDL